MSMPFRALPRHHGRVKRLPRRHLHPRDGPLFTDALEWEKATDVAVERFNALMRGNYGGRRLFDLAAIDSSKPGTRVSGRYDNHGYFALYDGYAHGDGFGIHLNAGASMMAATAFLDAIAQASRK